MQVSLSGILGVSIIRQDNLRSDKKKNSAVWHINVMTHRYLSLDDYLELRAFIVVKYNSIHLIVYFYINKGWKEIRCALRLKKESSKYLTSNMTKRDEPYMKLV